MTNNEELLPLLLLPLRRVALRLKHRILHAGVVARAGDKALVFVLIVAHAGEAEWCLDALDQAVAVVDLGLGDLVVILGIADGVGLLERQMGLLVDEEIDRFVL